MPAIERAQHVDMLWALADTFGPRRWSLGHTTIVLSLYGLRVLAGGLAEITHLDVDARGMWDSLRRSNEPLRAAEDVFRRLTAKEPFSLFEGSRERVAARVREDQLSRAILKLDRLDVNVRTFEDVAQVGEAVDHYLAAIAETGSGARGESFTPRALNVLGANLVLPHGPSADELHIQTAYDPACGFGGSLVALFQRFASSHDETRRLRLYGQDLEIATLFVCTWNFLLHGITDFKLAAGDVLQEPGFVKEDRDALEVFDVILSHPPLNWLSPEELHDFDRFQRYRYGPMPKRRADYAFVQHILASLSERGRAGVFVSIGALSRSFEREVRENLVHKGVVEAVISFPGGAVAQSSAPIALLVFSLNQDPSKRDEILFVDVSSYRVKRHQPLPPEMIDRVTAAYLRWASAPTLSAVVSLHDVAANDYDLTPTRFVSQLVQSVPDIDDIESKIQGLEEELADARARLNRALKRLDD